MGKLPAKWAWTSYFHQLWAKLKYGLGTNSSSVADLEELEEKPEKCFYYMIEYEWQEDGSWKYSELVDTTPAITVPLADGSHAAIDDLPVTCPK